MKYVSLLRGINVGGNNIIKMADLKKCFDDMGFANVRTYIQSGNVLFTASESAEALERKIEETLSKRFAYHARALVLSQRRLESVVQRAPREFGEEPEKYRYDVVFIKKPLTPAKAMQAVETRDGVDNAYRGQHVLYFKRLAAKATKSRFSKIGSKPEYQHMTIRNWNTTTRLLSLLDEI